MKLRVLGTVEADGAGLGPDKQRLVAAVLASHAGEPVPAGVLADAIWGGVPPRSAPANLSQYIGRLRQALGAELRIVKQAGGYLLEGDPSLIDAGCFEELATRARGEGDREEAAVLYRQALRLWRGPAYGDLADVPVIKPVADRLNERRLEVYGEHFDNELARGRHHECVADLSGLVTRHPLRERIRGQLMLALYRCGRQADALEVYRQGQEILGTELGLDTGQDLRRLNDAILASDPALDPPPQPAGRVHAPARKPPAELPPDTAAFTGRAPEIEQLRDVLSGQGSPVVITAIDGAGGIGKSALAIHAAHQMAGQFPGGQLYVNLHGATPGIDPLEPYDVLARFLRSLGIDNPPATTDEAAARYRSLTSGRRLLILLDDAASAAQVRPLLPGSHDCAVLITSRRTLSTLDSTSHLNLGTLTRTEALDLLARLVGPGRVEAEPDAAAGIVDLCGQLPLAVRVAGARLATRPTWGLADFLSRLAAAKTRLDELECDDLAVRTSFTVGQDTLRAEDPEAARAFELLGLWDGPDISTDIAAALIDRTAQNARETLDRLAETHLIEATAPRRYRMHDLVRLYAREQAQANIPERERTSAVRRLLHCYLATARHVHRHVDGDAEASGRLALGPQDLVHPGTELPTTESRNGWIDGELKNLIAAGRQAKSFADDGPAIASGLAATLFIPFYMRASSHDRMTLNEIALDAACTVGDKRAEAQARSDISDDHSKLGDPQSAQREIETALKLWRETGDHRDEISGLLQLGKIANRQQRHEEALAIFQKTRLKCTESGDRRIIFATLLAGNSNQALQRFDQAAVAHKEAHDQYEKLADKHGQALALENLAEDAHGAGRIIEAIGAFESCIDLAIRVGDRFLAAQALWRLGNSLHANKQLAEARDRWHQAVDLLEQLDMIGRQQAHAISNNPGLPETPEAIDVN